MISLVFPEEMSRLHSTVLVGDKEKIMAFCTKVFGWMEEFGEEVLGVDVRSDIVPFTLHVTRDDLSEYGKLVVDHPVSGYRVTQDPVPLKEIDVDLDLYYVSFVAKSGPYLEIEIELDAEQFYGEDAPECEDMPIVVTKIEVALPMLLATLRKLK